MEQATEPSIATRAPPLPLVSATIKFPSLSEQSNGNELSSLPRHSEMENDSSRLQNQQEPVVEKQANRPPVIVETSKSSTHHQITTHAVNAYSYECCCYCSKQLALVSQPVDISYN